MMNNQPASHRFYRNSRQGNSSMELAMFLPFLALFIMAFFTVASYTLSYCKVETDSRYHAWKYRHAPWRAPETETIDMAVRERVLTIQGGESRISPKEAIVHQSELEVLRFLQGFPKTIAQKKHIVLGGVWDHREIRFPDRNSHRPLTLMNKVNYFATNRRVELRAFQRLERVR